MPALLAALPSASMSKVYKTTGRMNSDYHIVLPPPHRQARRDYSAAKSKTSRWPNTSSDSPQVRTRAAGHSTAYFAVLTNGRRTGVIVGGVFVLLVLTAMLVSTVIVVWRSRPARAHKQRRSLSAARDLERAPPSLARGRARSKTCSDTSSSPSAKEKEREQDTDADADESMDSTSSADHDSPLPPPTPVMHPSQSRVSPSIPSTLNVYISPSAPHLVKLGADGALEFRVTPPSPVLIPKGGSMRFGGTPGENDSVWWVI